MISPAKDAAATAVVGFRCNHFFPRVKSAVRRARIGSRRSQSFQVFGHGLSSGSNGAEDLFRDTSGRS